jgi:hypothetical protein
MLNSENTNHSVLAIINQNNELVVAIDPKDEIIETKKSVSSKKLTIPISNHTSRKVTANISKTD